MNEDVLAFIQAMIQYGMSPDEAFALAAQSGMVHPDAYGSHLYDGSTAWGDEMMPPSGQQNPGIGDAFLTPVNLPAPGSFDSGMQDLEFSPFTGPGLYPGNSDVFPSTGDISSGMFAPNAMQQELPPDLDSLIMDEILTRLMADARQGDQTRQKTAQDQRFATMGRRGDAARELARIPPPPPMSFAVDSELGMALNALASGTAPITPMSIDPLSVDQAGFSPASAFQHYGPGPMRGDTGGIMSPTLMGLEPGLDSTTYLTKASQPTGTPRLDQYLDIYEQHRPPPKAFAGSQAQVPNRGQVISSQRNKGQRGEQMSSARSNAARLTSAAAGQRQQTFRQPAATQRQTTTRPTTVSSSTNRGTAAARATAPPPPKYLPQNDMKNVGRGRR